MFCWVFINSPRRVLCRLQIIVLAKSFSGRIAIAVVHYILRGRFVTKLEQYPQHEVICILIWSAYLVFRSKYQVVSNIIMAQHGAVARIYPIRVSHCRP